MKTNHDNLTLWFVIGWVSILAACGVEVGNPTGGKKGGGGSGGGSSGTLSIFLADSFSRQFQGAVLNLRGVSLLAPSGADGTSIVTSVGGSFQGALDSRDLAQGKTFALSQSSEVPAGDYQGLALGWDGATPLLINDGGEALVPAAMSNQDSTMAVDQSFSVSQGEEISIVLHLDLRRSLKRNGGRFDFGPRAHMVLKEDQATIEGVVSGLDVGQVCAYLRRQPDFNDGQFGPLPKRRGPDRGAQLHGSEHHGDDSEKPGRRQKARGPDSLDPKDPELGKDDDLTCDRAFSTADLVGGQYRLEHLWPGLYSLRFLDANGVLREDLKREARVKPGETIRVP